MYVTCVTDVEVIVDKTQGAHSALATTLPLYDQLSNIPRSDQSTYNKYRKAALEAKKEADTIIKQLDQSSGSVAPAGEPFFPDDYGQEWWADMDMSPVSSVLRTIRLGPGLMLSAGRRHRRLHAWRHTRGLGIRSRPDSQDLPRSSCAFLRAILSRPTSRQSASKIADLTIAGRQATLSSSRAPKRRSQQVNQPDGGIQFVAVSKLVGDEAD